MKKKSTVAVDDMVEKYADAILAHLGWGIVPGGKRGKYHIIVGKKIFPDKKVVSLCHIGEPLIAKDTPVLYENRCKECDLALARLVTHVAAKDSRYLFALMGNKVSVGLDEVRAALLAVDEDTKEQLAYDKLMLPEEYLPVGSGQLLQRGW